MHNFKKKFGQNFITDTNLLKAIVFDGEINNEDEVLEIGAGAGSLTKQLSEQAKKVVAYEIDKDLQPTLESLELNNVKFIYKDALKEPIKEIEKEFSGTYKIVANLPYYITTPLIFKFLTETNKVTSLTIMVQKEVADRIVAKEGSKDYGVLSVMCQFYSLPKITRIVKRQMFYPIPNVDSAIVTMKKKEMPKYINIYQFEHFVKKCFSMRRKTLLNNLIGYNNMSKEEIVNKLGEEMSNKRAETLSLEDFLKMFKQFKV